MHSNNTSFFSTTMILSTITIFMLCSLMNNAVMAQRPSYAGPRPQSGYKDRFTSTNTPAPVDLSSRFDDNPNRVQQPPSSSVDIVRPISQFIPINNQQSNEIPEVANRFSSNSAQSNRLPHDARGDSVLVERLNSLPFDQRPFWLINAEAIEAHRNRNPAQLGNTNVIAERGSFLGPLNNNNRQQQQQQPQQFQQLRQQPRQQSNNLVSRNDFDVANRIGDSQSGRLVYVQPNVYNALRRANLIA